MLGDLLRAVRNKAGMSQEQLALQANVDRSYISEIKRDLKNPTVDMLLRLCKAMGASASAIVAQLEQGEE